MRKHKRKTCIRMGLWVRFEDAREAPEAVAG